MRKGRIHRQQSFLRRKFLETEVFVSVTFCLNSICVPAAVPAPLSLQSPICAGAVRTDAQCVDPNPPCPQSGQSDFDSGPYRLLRRKAVLQVSEEASQSWICSPADV